MNKLLQYLVRWGDRFYWLWLGLAAPFMMFPTPVRSLAMLVVPGTWILHGVAKYQSSLVLPRKKRLKQITPIPLTPLNGAVLLLALMVLVSIWATYDIAVSFPKISGMVLAFGAFFAFVRAGKNWPGWLLSLGLYLGSGVGVAGLGLLGTRWHATKFTFLTPVLDRIPEVYFGFQGAETGFNPNEVAGALTWVLPLLITLSFLVLLPRQKLILLTPGDKSLGKFTGAVCYWGVRMGLWLGTSLAGAVFALTQSRSGYLGLGVSFLLLLWVVMPSRGRWLLFGIILIAGLALWFGLSGESGFQIRNWLFASGAASGGALSLNSLEGRIEVWLRGVYGLSDFPFTGMGMNTFRNVVHVLYPLFVVVPDIDIGHAHNEFLQAGLDLGIPGLIAFISLYMLSFWMLADLWKNISQFDGPRQMSLQAVLLGLGGGLFAHLLYGVADAVALGAKPGVLFWMLLGLITSLYMQIKSNQDEAHAPPIARFVSQAEMEANHDGLD